MVQCPNSSLSIQPRVDLCELAPPLASSEPVVGAQEVLNNGCFCLTLDDGAWREHWTRNSQKYSSPSWFGSYVLMC